jgi:hypothetical protein
MNEINLDYDLSFENLEATIQKIMKIGMKSNLLQVLAEEKLQTNILSDDCIILDAYSLGYLDCLKDFKRGKIKNERN